jgi:hypothetical protein
MKKRVKPVKAYDNREFLHSHSGRIVRVLSEFIEPQHRFERHHIKRNRDRANCIKKGCF